MFLFPALKAVKSLARGRGDKQEMWRANNKVIKLVPCNTANNIVLQQKSLGVTSKVSFPSINSKKKTPTGK